jgi:hypothetical protein
VLEAIRRIGRGVLGANRRHPLPEPRHRPRPADPLGDHGRRHLRIHRQQRPNPGLGRTDRRFHRRPLIPWWPIAGQRCSDRLAGHAQPLGNRSLRQRLAVMQVPDQRPVFQGDHPSDRGWVDYFSTGTTGPLFDRRQHPAAGQHSVAALWRVQQRCRTRTFLGWNVALRPGATVDCRALAGPAAVR